MAGCQNGRGGDRGKGGEGVTLGFGHGDGSASWKGESPKILNREIGRAHV